MESSDPLALPAAEFFQRFRGESLTFDDLHVLPIFAAVRLRHNHLTITPFAGEPLVGLVVQDRLPARDRVGLLLGAVRGLRALHDHGLCHADFTLRNILVQTSGGSQTAVVFDFDLTLALDELGRDGPVTYAEHYEDRVVGSPEYSVVPELLDPVLQRTPLSIRRDLYAVGTALYGLFTDASVYGDVADLPTLLARIADGVVRQGDSRIDWPAEMSPELRDIALRCLERDPAHRFQDATALLRALELAQAQLSATARARFRATLDYVHDAARKVKLKDIVDNRPDITVGEDEIRRAQAMLARHGYLLERSLGRVKGHPIYQALPDPKLVATGRVVKAGRTVGLVECDIVDAADALVARATSTCMTLRGAQAVGRDGGGGRAAR